MNIVVNLNIDTWFDKEEILEYTRIFDGIMIEGNKVFFKNGSNKIELGIIRNVSEPIYIGEDNK